MTHLDVDGDALRRRYGRLREVHEATGSLITLRNVDALLKEITQRARLLLRCDSVYLDLPTSDDPTVFAVRTWSGDLTPASLGTTVSRGNGVGGIVLETGEPFQVENYLSNEDIQHETAHDDMLAGNDIATLLAVPLVFGGRITGLLFAARRLPRSFDEDDILILTALATHAAIAVRNAQIDEEKEAALGRLSDAVTESERQRDVLTRSALVHGTLSDLVIQGATVREVLEAINSTLDIPVAFLDRSVPHRPRHLSVGGLVVTPDVAGRIIDSAEPSPRMRSVTTGDERWLVVDAVTGEGMLGTLVTPENPRVDTDLGRVLERAVQSLSLCQLSTRALAAADRRSATELVTKLLQSPPRMTEQLRRRASRHGIDDRGAVPLVSDINAPSALQVAAEWTDRSGGLFASIDDRLVILVTPDTPTPDIHKLTDRLIRQADGTGPGNIIVGGHSHGIEHTADEYVAACRALKFADSLGVRGAVHSADEWSVFSTLFHEPDSASLDRFIQENIGPILSYDDRHQSSLSETAKALLEDNLSPKAAAVRLGVHANTVNQRAARLDRLLGETWRRHPRAFIVLAALNLHALRTDL
ncbi:GAF domain-containing protein [Corynebacterium variabile]|uniref:helix-turn-helix domain-containing protein n=1 Tax=Corynebacterium variabile TaxID=1727 RepID=UPI002649CF46|nr:GAF domain-containing protein [Corynebacterium variabile]MDN6241142.1 GAF domain-containing protein [Corynebacterium variabile]MDN6676513.1 GAF domain-containing protein [Corynebacterium variabile]MDN6845316.1 GAF domain-containing protein [Corynebacterium variabile]